MDYRGLIILGIIFLSSFIMAQDPTIYNDCEIYGNCQPLWCALTGCTMTGDLNVIGNFKSGNYSTDYFALADDGELSLYGNARVVRHLRVGAANWEKGASAPSENFEGVFPTLDFDNTIDDEAYYTLIVPHRWDNSTDIEFAVDWFYDGAQDDGTVDWVLEYKGVKEGEAVTGAGTTITKTSAGAHITGQMVRTTFTTKILATNLEAEDSLGIRLYRDVSEDTLGTDARLINTHFHFIQNKLGGSL